MASSLLSSALFTFRLSCEALRERYFVLGEPVSQAHLHDYAAALLIGSREIVLAERDVSD